MTLPFDTRKLPPPAPPVTEFLDPEVPQATGEDLGDHGFTREFEGVPAVPGDALVPVIGPVPEVGVGHASLINDEPEKVWVLPTPELLDTITGKRERLAAEVRATGDKIVSTLQSFGIETRIVGANSGPTVTQYELQPAVGVPVRRILGYQTDLALALAAPIRIQPFIPGKSAIGVEVPNKAAQLVSLKETVESPAFTDKRNRLSVALGADVSGHPVIGDLTRMPHLLIAGATGSGKSVCINAVLGGFLLQATPAQLKMILIDPKRVELSNFGDLPHLLVPVVVEPESAVAALRWAVKEMEERYKLFASHGARNIVAFNEKAPGLGVAPLPYVVIVIDELADLMMVAAGRDRGSHLPDRAARARRRPAPDRRDSATVGRHHHRAHQGQHPEPCRLRRVERRRLARHPRRDGRREAPRSRRHAVPADRRGQAAPSAGSVRQRSRARHAHRTLEAAGKARLPGGDLHRRGDGLVGARRRASATRCSPRPHTPSRPRGARPRRSCSER